MNTPSLSILFEALKNNGILFIEYAGEYYFLVATNNPELVKQIELHKATAVLLVDSTVKLESYVKELNPLVYDLVEYSERPVILELPHGTNLPEKVLLSDGSLRVRVVRNGILQQLIRKYRSPLFLINITELDHNNTTTYEFSEEDAFLDYSEIRLEPNGKVQIKKN